MSGAVEGSVGSLHAAARAAELTNDAAGLERTARALIAAAEAAGDCRETAFGYFFLGRALYWRNDPRGPEKAFARALELSTELGDRAAMARNLIGMAATALYIDANVHRAHELYERALHIARELDDKKLVARTQGDLALAYYLDGESSIALRHAIESSKLFEALGERAHAGSQRATAGGLHALRGEFPEAFAAMREAYAALQSAPNPRTIAWYFDAWKTVAAFMHRWESAALLFGFATEYRDRQGILRLQGLFPEFTASMESMVKHLGSDRFEELVAQGAAMTIEEAQAETERLIASYGA